MIPHIGATHLLTYSLTDLTHRRLGAAHSDLTLTLTLTPNPNRNQGSEQLTQTEYLLHRETLLR